MDSGSDNLTVVVIGGVSAVLVDALWDMGLRPVRGCRGPLIWRRPKPGEGGAR